MPDRPFSIDHPEDFLYLAVGATAIIIAVSVNTTLDGQVRYLFSDTGQYFSITDSDSETLSFQESQVEKLNWAGQTSLGLNSVGDERLYCLTISQGSVSNLRLVDSFESSEKTSVSGTCYNVYGSIDGFIHTQPAFSGQLSDEDKDLESDISYTCIQYDEISSSPINSRLGGINCWKVEGATSNPEFNQVTPVIAG